MTGKIVAFVDGSIYATSVCDHAAWISKRTGAPVQLVHVLRPGGAPALADPADPAPLGARSGVMEELAALDAQRARLMAAHGRALIEDARVLLEKAGVAEISAELRQGDLLATVQAFEAEARVILLGKRGEDADQAMDHLGANLERIVRSCARPVFVASRAFKPIERVLIAYDGGVSAMKKADTFNKGLQFALLAIWDEFIQAKPVENMEFLHPKLERVLAQLNNPSGEMSLGQLARNVKMSPYYLSTLFREQLGLTIPEYRNRQRLNRFFGLYRAKPEIRLLELALEAGFGSYAQFYRIFTKAVGQTPQSWGKATQE